MDNQKNAEKCLIFVCEKCDFKCSKESNYKLHIDTNKHKRVTESNKKMPTKDDKTFICICGNSYKYRPGLAKHKRTCIMEKMHTSSSIVTKDNYETTDGLVLENEINKKIDSTTDKELKELVKELIKQNGELVKTINDIVPKIGNTNITNNNNNNFNLNVFLNEQCKDALNISDFIDSLKITLEDLLFSKTNGISRGITDVMIKGLKELDIHKRPIHCTDIKRDIMYIKNEDNWSKDDNHDIMKYTIVKIADKERTALQQWAIDNPDWIETEIKQLEYLTMMRSICEPIENYNNYERKIIKILSKEIQLDKKSQ
jgi:ferritin